MSVEADVFVVAELGEKFKAGIEDVLNGNAISGSINVTNAVIAAVKFVDRLVAEAQADGLPDVVDAGSLTVTVEPDRP